MSDRNPTVQQRRIHRLGGITVAIGPYSESPAYSYLAAVKTIAKPFTRHRIIVVDPRDRRQLRQVRCIRQHLRQRHPDRKPCEENLIHSPSSPVVIGAVGHASFSNLAYLASSARCFSNARPAIFGFMTKAGHLAVGLNTRGFGEFGRACASKT